MISAALNGPGWKARGDFVAPECHKRGRFFPRVRHIIKFLPLLVRFFVYTIALWWRRRRVFINMFQAMKSKPFYGVPCGGIGSGAIGRDFRGGFCKYSLLPGIVEQNVESIKANQQDFFQFIISVRRASDGECVYQKVLSCVPHPTNPLTSWDFGFPAQNISYRGLYPRSWTQYEIPELDIVLICRQISPIIPHDYKDTCLPVCVFVWSVENLSSNDFNISLVFTFRNGTGNRTREKESLCRVEEFLRGKCSGIKLRHSISALEVCYALEERTEGEVDLGVAICAEFPAKCKSSAEVEFVLAWDMPIVKFGAGRRQYRRRYARFFPDASKRVEQMCSRALMSRIEWERKIDAWQQRILSDDSLPDWHVLIYVYKSALFNESYFLTDGGTCWFEYDDEWRSTERQMSNESAKYFKEFGRFAYLEAWEYYMLNTYDVHFYSSFALLENWPLIELAIQLDFADQVLSSCDRKSVNINESTRTAVKRLGRLPHDLGNPMDEPWLHLNAYALSDTCEWKDLNLKFVLTCYRDYEKIVKIYFNDDNEMKGCLLRRFYDLSSGIIVDAKAWDVDGDDLIENAGQPDQTYDVWSMHGSSDGIALLEMEIGFVDDVAVTEMGIPMTAFAYCGGLWLCALECVRRMALTLGEVVDAQKFANKLNNARKAFERKLWNGKYFDFDEHSTDHKSIMADQLCGFWFMCITDGKVDDVIITRQQICASLKTIFEYNVEKFANGQLGPVNAMMPSGVVDSTGIQSEEVWGGVAYALASFHLLVEENESAFKTAEGWYRSCWERYGLQYQSPEAINESSYYRAIGYMRPLAIWAMQSALDALRNKRQ
uniref:NLGase n=1 Tax=Ascaris lumbricoides TaxID=6252 RepID=A0A9J2P6F5_ASCLU